jgi:GNAT superfamily N-acetyltransferase
VCKLVYIRTADIKDRDNIWPLARDFASSFVLDRTCFDASFDLLVTRPDTLLLIAERSQDDVIGYLLTFGHATFLANGPVTWVEEIMVAEQARRTGVGRKLMEAAEVGAHPPAPPTSLWQRGDQPLSTARSVIKTRRRTSERCFRPSLSEGRPLEAKSRSRSRDQIKIKNEVGPGGRWGATP